MAFVGGRGSGPRGLLAFLGGGLGVWGFAGFGGFLEVLGLMGFGVSGFLRLSGVWVLLAERPWPRTQEPGEKASIKVLLWFGTGSCSMLCLNSVRVLFGSKKSHRDPAIIGLVHQGFASAYRSKKNRSLPA